MHRSEIETVAGFVGGVRYRLVKLRAGEQYDAAGRRQITDAQRLQGLLRLRLLARITADMLSRRRTVAAVPIVVIVDLRIVADGLGKVARIEGHSVIRLQRVDRDPPVELAGRRRVPSVAVRMEGIGDARSEELRRIRRAQA